MKNNTTSANYATSAAYNTASQLTGFTYGNSTTASYGYSSTRMQLSSVAYSNGGSIFSLSYGYSQSGNNNGQVASITDNAQSGRTATYTYDARRRLATAGTSGSGGYPAWGLSWTYDDYGNRTAQSVTAGSGPSNSVSVSTSTNRITGMGGYTFYYDSSGNLTQDDLYKFKYDGEHRLVEIRNLSDTLISTYAYDGHSLRVIKVVGADRTWSLYAGTQLVSEFEDAASATYSSPTSPGSLPADSVSTLLYQHADHLTTRVTTDQQGQVSNEQAHYPYGEQWYVAGQADPSVERKFTSYLKDSEVATGKLNYAVFRQHSARVARFNRPDPVRGNIRNPQRLNRYAYVMNSPIERTDRLGLDPAYLEDLALEAPINSGVAYQGMTMFDAVAGAPGTYLVTDVRGNVTWGFSVDLWTAAWSIIDNIQANAPEGTVVSTTGFQTYVTNYGGSHITYSGLLPMVAEQQQANYLVQTAIDEATRRHREVFLQRIAAGMPVEVALERLYREVQNDPAVNLWGGYAADVTARVVDYIESVVIVRTP